MTKKHQKMQKSTPTFAKKNHQKNAKKMHNMGEMAFSASPPLTHCVVDGHKPPRGTSVRVWLRSVCGGVGGLHSGQGQTNLREQGGGGCHTHSGVDRLPSARGHTSQLLPPRPPLMP